MNTQTNVASLYAGDNEMMKIEAYLDARLGAGTAVTVVLMNKFVKIDKDYVL